MHYYKRNIGDYHKKAGRLSMLQHGAYNLLIDSCYDREKFPTLEEAIEWTWASTTEEIEAVEFVLKRFFVLNGDVYEQDRILEEVEKYQSKSETNKRIAREREANRRKESTKRAQGVDEAPPNQEPRTKNQEPSPQAPESGGDREKAKSIIVLMNGIAGTDYKLVDSNIKPIMARISDGYDVSDFSLALAHRWEVWSECSANRLPGEKDMLEYYRPSTLFRPSKFPGYVEAAKRALNEATSPVTARTSTRAQSIQQDLLDTSWATPSPKPNQDEE
jgi:uncharacterized phage protein (TIGR02220 family)